jgi:hypothetical protein
MQLSQPICAPEGHRLFLMFVDGGPQPPQLINAWKLAAPGQDAISAGDLSGHIDMMMKMGVQQRVVHASGCMQSIDLRLSTVTNLSKGTTFRLTSEIRHKSVAPRPYKCDANSVVYVCCVFTFLRREWPVTENSMLFNIFDSDGNEFHITPNPSPYVIVKSRTFQRKPMLQLPCTSIRLLSFTPLQDVLPFSDLLLCSGVPLEIEDMLTKVREHPRSSVRCVAAQDLDDCCIGKDVVPLTDCMTGGRMSLPGRSIHCQHASAFDLPGFLDAAIKTGLWRCPICLPCSLQVKQLKLLTRVAPCTQC